MLKSEKSQHFQNRCENRPIKKFEKITSARENLASSSLRNDFFWISLEIRIEIPWYVKKSSAKKDEKKSDFSRNFFSKSRKIFGKKKSDFSSSSFPDTLASVEAI